MRQSHVHKCLAVGIILLFVAIAYSPAISAYDDTIVSKVFSILKNENMVSITVMEYKADGTIGKSVVKMSQELADKFQEEMKEVNDLDSRLSIYKEYNLISQNVTADTLRAGMEEKAQRMGLTQDKLEHMVKNNQTLFNKLLYINLFCSVFGYAWPWPYGAYFVIPFGLSLFTRFINNDGWPGKLRSFDFLDFLIGKLYFYSLGILGSYDHNFRGIITMVGFVGYMYNDYDFLGGYFKGFDGFAVYVKAVDPLS